MALFYFNLSLQDIIIWDEEGQDLPDVSTALRIAREDACNLTGDFLRGGVAVLPEFIFVVDEGGRELCALDVRATALERIDMAFRRGGPRR
jgi:hypothetical protein